jgi:hypothetical protein
MPPNAAQTFFLVVMREEHYSTTSPSARRVPTTQQQSSAFNTEDIPWEATRMHNRALAPAAFVAGYDIGASAIIEQCEQHRVRPTLTFARQHRIGPTSGSQPQNPTRRVEKWPANSAPLIACGAPPGWFSIVRCSGRVPRKVTPVVLNRSPVASAGG